MQHIEINDGEKVTYVATIIVFFLKALRYTGFYYNLNFIVITYVIFAKSIAFKAIIFKLVYVKGFFNK